MCVNKFYKAFFRESAVCSVLCCPCVRVYLVNDVISKVLGRQDKHSVKDISGLFNQLFPAPVVVVLSLQPRNLQCEWSV